ncbi:MAG: flavin reductase [Oscillospiraceae bacterium]|nr:flavin reductase [Oscillospiraceae bacterium]
MQFNTEIFSLFDKKWALLCAGTKDAYNAMTIAWGGLGTLWCRPVATVYVRPSRYTYQFMEENEYFTVSFYPEKNRQDLLTMGTVSGRDGDKIAKTTLTPKPLENAVTFAQAEVTLLCRKLYCQDLDLDAMPADVVEEFYKEEPVSRMYVGEVVEIIEK